jgi:hypothetical protein
VAIDHWNTDNPHIHILVRGRTGDGGDLVIDGDYIAEGIRGRAEERVTLELGLRSEQDMRLARKRDVEAERWTGLDRQLVGMVDADFGTVDLRPNRGGGDEEQRLLTGEPPSLPASGWPSSRSPGSGPSALMPRRCCAISRSGATSSRRCIAR